jgi:hypothetical protein
MKEGREERRKGGREGRKEGKNPDKVTGIHNLKYPLF